MLFYEMIPSAVLKKDKKNGKDCNRFCKVILMVLLSFCYIVCSSVPSTDALTADTKDILEELTRFLNLEKLLPSYRFTVTVRLVFVFVV